MTDHPAVFATLTAPSFGVVHTRPLDAGGQPRHCQPRRDAPVCTHGLALSCKTIHDDGDPCLGEPLCPGCFDYAGAVVWNNALGELWRRTGSVYLPRILARQAEMTQTRAHELVRVAYVKVAEYQRRGLVHLHVLARLDRPMPDYRAEQLRPPSPRFSAQLLEDALRETIAEVSAPVPDELGDARIRWGTQLGVRQLNTGEERDEIAGYLAKYATKSTEQAGGLLHRIDAGQVDHAPVREHVRRYLRTAFDLNTTVGERRAATRSRGGEPAPDVETDWNPSALAIRVRRAMGHGEPLRVRLHDGSAHIGRVLSMSDARPAREDTTIVIELDSGERLHLADVASIGPANRRTPRSDRRDPRLAACAHAFGYRGHCLTKSRRYSTTFKALREAREAYVHEQILARSPDATQRAIAETAANERIATFECVGTGHITAADEYLAASAAARARERRRIARQERWSAPGEHSMATVQVGQRVTGESPALGDEARQGTVRDG